MMLTLTRKGDGVKIVVNLNQIKMLEPDSDGTSTHVVFGADMVRVVTESVAQISAMTAKPLF